MNASAHRLLTGMRELVAEFEPTRNAATFDRLARQLSAAIDTLHGHVDDDWLEELRSAWWAFEVVNAVATSDERMTLSATEVATVAAARESLAASLAAY